MDAYDCMQIDKAMSRRIDAIYGDPARHQFESCFDFHKANSSRGRRGGHVYKRARKTVCYWCGQGKPGHADKTEEL